MTMQNLEDAGRHALQAAAGIVKRVAVVPKAIVATIRNLTTAPRYIPVDGQAKPVLIPPGQSRTLRLHPHHLDMIETEARRDVAKFEILTGKEADDAGGQAPPRDPRIKDRGRHMRTTDQFINDPAMTERKVPQTGYNERQGEAGKEGQEQVDTTAAQAARETAERMKDQARIDQEARDRYNALNRDADAGHDPGRDAPVERVVPKSKGQQ